ncbi:VOC family protein [Staphylococcus sp. Marseille-Q5304]|uniref:VOC family protein n=1 Tax=Staphylococcus sp. Marseille-Q5304 TaxID=2942200 RepID=UPI002073314D|nr:VOC family protein [Staphylococcus sp. Marseille-Q5304]
MEIQSAWLNLPVKDLEASEKFFEEIGFTIKKQEGVIDKMRGIETVDNKVIMLIEQSQFEKVARLNEIGKNEALVSISVKTNEQVDELLELVERAGGKVLEKGTVHEGLYGGLFSDVDEHLFNVIAM